MNWGRGMVGRVRMSDDKKYGGHEDPKFRMTVL
jgi:hypothetical protein